MLTKMVCGALCDYKLSVLQFPLELVEGGTLERLPLPTSQHHSVQIFRTSVGPWQPVPAFQLVQPLLEVLLALV